MSIIFSGGGESSSSQVLIEPDNANAGELAGYFQSENTLGNGQESKGGSWRNFVGLNRGGVATKAIFALLLLLFLLNVIITCVNWRSNSISSSSSSVEKIHLDESNANFSMRLEQLRAEFDAKLKTVTGETLKSLSEQKNLLESSQNSSSISRGKIQDLELQLEHLDELVNDIYANHSGTTSNMSAGVSENKENILKLSQIIDHVYSLLESQGHGENGTGSGSGMSSGNFTRETKQRLEFVQEVWREGKTGLVLAQEISPQENLRHRVSELKSKLERLKTQPSRFDVDDRKILFDLLSNSSSIRMNRTDVCGGSFNFSASAGARLRYEKLESDEAQKAQPCIWVIWANGVSTIKLQLVDLNGELKIYNKFNLAQTNRPAQNWSSADIFSEKLMDSNIVVVVFTPSPQATSDVMEIGLRIVNPLPTLGDVTMTKVTVTSTAQTLSSSSGQSSTLYDDNERRFYFIYPPPGEKVRVSMQTVSTEQTHDYLQLFKYDNSAKEFQFLRKYTGSFHSYTLNVNHDGLEGQPLLIYFHTDTSKADEGFTAVVRSVSV